MGHLLHNFFLKNSGLKSFNVAYYGFWI